MANTDASTKYYEALNETSDAVIDAIRAANDRGHRFTAALIEQAQESQREAVELTRKWAEAPFDFVGLLSSVTESNTKAQGRALDATRQFFGELSEVQKESRNVIQKVITANRTAGEASIELARGAFSKATTAVQTATDSNGSNSSSAKADTKTDSKTDSKTDTKAS